MRGTKVYAAEVEQERCFGLVEEARKIPVITLSLNSPSFSAQAWKRANEAVYQAALAHGLPEIEGYYGMDIDGEFLEA